MQTCPQPFQLFEQRQRQCGAGNVDAQILFQPLSSADAANTDIRRVKRVKRNAVITIVVPQLQMLLQDSQDRSLDGFPCDIQRVKRVYKWSDARFGDSCGIPTELPAERRAPSPIDHLVVIHQLKLLAS